MTEQDWREESIKTRIETIIILNVCRVIVDWREESIKTRIETIVQLMMIGWLIEIEEKNPLKQGLKLFRPDLSPKH